MKLSLIEFIGIWGNSSPLASGVSSPGANPGIPNWENQRYVIKIQVFCKKCGKSIYRGRGRINENLKLGHNFYCSRSCEYAYRTNRKILICENCQKGFTKTASAVLSHNYCSRSCAVRINNQKFPKRGQGFKICAYAACRNEFKGEIKYCLKECVALGRKRHAPEELISKLQAICRELGRVPAKREILPLAHSCRYVFGSWNDALLAAGFTANRSHSERMYKRIGTKAKDGHVCDSISEAIIDNWFTNHGIAHEKNILYPTTHHKADWSISDIFVEYFGLAKGSPRYDRAIKRKQDLCRKHNIRLIELYPEDIYPKVLLENKFSSFL